jgi:hypothetical protein
MNSRHVEVILRGDIPTEDRVARERALERLRISMAAAEENVSRPKVFRRPGWWVAAAAAVAALVVGLQFVLPPGSGGPSSAAAEIRELGRVSAAQSSLQLGASDVLYRRYEETRPESVTNIVSGSAYVTRVHVMVESWLMRDGSGSEQTRYLDDEELVSEADRQAWIEAGSPQLHVAGDVAVATSKERELHYYPVEQLPTNPDELRATLISGSVIERSDNDRDMLYAIGTLLAQQNLSGDQRTALFEVAAKIPNVTITIDTVDPAGRPATEVSLGPSTDAAHLFFDPNTATLLGQSEEFSPGDGRPALIQSEAYLVTDVVARVGDRPATGT